MKKFIVNLLCCVVPSRKIRHRIRHSWFKNEEMLATLLKQIQILQKQNTDIYAGMQRNNDNIANKIKKSNDINTRINNKISEINNTILKTNNTVSDIISATNDAVINTISKTNKNIEQKISNVSEISETNLTGIINQITDIKQDFGSFSGMEKRLTDLQQSDTNFTINQLKDSVFKTRHELELFINRDIEKKISTALLHKQTFSRFKGIHAGKDIVILATGPSLNDFKPIKNAIYIGVNSAFKYDKVKLDYLFAQDYKGLHNYIEDMDKYQGNNCIKFYGLTTEYDGDWERVIPESHAIRANALRYRTEWELLHGAFECKFAHDISTMSMGCFGSIVFPALQFALWTNPRRIYLVGCDCSDAGHFDKTKCADLSYLLNPWHKFKEFVSIYYPETEIISVNPVGLRRLFKDLDQKDIKDVKNK